MWFAKDFPEERKANPDEDDPQARRQAGKPVRNQLFGQAQDRCPRDHKHPLMELIDLNGYNDPFTSDELDRFVERFPIDP
jgi:hypothetical protein